MDMDIVKRFICGAKEAYKKVGNHSFNFPITIESAYRLATNIEKLLKEQEAREPHYTTLKYLIEGMEMIVHHPECPRCIENGLEIWDAEIKKGQAYCNRCGQAVKWI